MAPTLAAAVQQQTRVMLTLTWPGIQTATIQRLDPDGVLRNVRNAEPVVCNGSCVAWDHEAPLDAAVTYRATSPQGTGTVASDAFGRTVANGWGTADAGGTWTISQDGGTTADYSVAPGTGSMSNAALSTRHRILISSALGDVDQYVTTSSPVVALTANIESVILARYADANNLYAGGIQFQPGGTILALIFKRVAGVQSTIASVTVPGLTYAANTQIRVRFTVQGSALSLKVWLASVAEPAAYTLTGTDTAITAAGQVGLSTVINAGNTNTLPVATAYSNYVANSLAPLTVVASPTTVPSGGQAWLTHPGHPQYAGMATVTPTGLTELRPSRRGIFAPIGTSLPVVVNDVRGGSSGTLVVQTATAADIARLRNMLADGAPLLLRQPSSWGGDAWWLSVGDAGVDRFTQIATDGYRRWNLPYQRIDRPAGTSDGAVGQTYNDLKATYATYNALNATGKTYTQLAQSVT